MEFCDECGSMMKTEGDMWVCGSCGAETPREAATESGMVTTQGQEAGEVVDLSDSEADARPTTEIQCVECDNDRAYWELKQIRAADESETRFFTCTECGHKWREDDH
ncbi:transcription termination factor Tfs [Halorhabdus utahensis DSM 12940]|uniref:Transcription factor S n=1 Tax=Halorhabdus utahensis (strain DSM 12940 / JCM 11049 / AX-2) TaxID=519442 RepID=C7NPX2_HALUD|nr:transcription factor S [Halorhabdus utahensis]ACV10419.1 transcription termination factor Tfs [Halorhabdus utahensis DSM 12940]